jgi:CPA1 family monovalent cation:H+ antiporter
METEAVLNSVLSVISLLLIATFVSFFLRKSKFPYTVALVLVGLSVGYLAERLPVLSFLQDFRLSPELVFYVFLPTLIFESAFHTNIRHFTQNIKTIVSLSTVGMLMSTLLIGSGMHYFLQFPWAISLLFGALISATDPISVIAQFKQIGAPRRLMTILEGESLFNDGMALVLFGILLEVIGTQDLHFGRAELLGSFGNFGFVVIGGLLVGTAFGFLFSKALDYIKDSKEIEISITLILAHSTFIIAEYFLGVSGILSTVAAGIVIGNYGAYKISPSVKDIMTHFWDYSAYIANSLLFLLVGMIVYSTKDVVAPLFIPMLFVILLVILSRMVMVYSLMPLTNLLFKRERIPVKWMHVIQWSGLRGALAIALILTLPEGFLYYDEMLIFTVGVIFFTIIVNGLTVSPLLSVLGLKSFSVLESFEHEENQVYIGQKVHSKMDLMLKKKFIDKKTHKKISEQYQEHCENCSEHVHELLRDNQQELSTTQVKLILKRHLLGIEKRAFTKLYYQGEITQELLHVLLHNVNRQMEKRNLDATIRLGQLTLISPQNKIITYLEKLGFKGIRKRMRRKEVMLRYEMFRARLISTDSVLESLKEIQKTKVFLDKKLLKEFNDKYTSWKKKAKEKLSNLEKEDPEACESIQLYLAQQAAFHTEEKALIHLEKSGMTSPKVYGQLRSGLMQRKDDLKF